LELDSKLEAYYPMRYDSVFSFVDIKQKDFKDFHLPMYALANPEGEQVHILRTSTSTSTPTLPSSPASSINITDYEEHTIYIQTDPDDWTCLKKMGLEVIRLNPYLTVESRKSFQLI